MNSFPKYTFIQYIPAKSWKISLANAKLKDIVKLLAIDTNSVIHWFRLPANSLKEKKYRNKIRKEIKALIS